MPHGVVPLVPGAHAPAGSPPHVPYSQTCDASQKRESEPHMPHATFYVLRGGHYLHLDARADLSRALGDHLRG